jgi:glycosyltransferase involved in cell wall biosynthesis
VRVLMVVRPASGGMREHVLALVHGLLGEGHEVELAVPTNSQITRSAHDAGLVLHPIPFSGPLNPVQDARAVGALSRIIASGGFDIVHAHGIKAGFIGRLAVAGAGGGVCPFIVTVHSHVLARTDSRTARWRHRTLDRSLDRYVTRYIAISESIARELIQAHSLPAEKVVVVPTGVDITPFLAEQDCASARLALGVPVDAPVVGLAGRFSAHKGLRDLVTAMPEIIRRVPGVRFVVGGSGLLESQLRNQAVALGVADSIVWPGHVLNMPRFLSALDVFVSSATTEAFGIALIEAAAAGVPTVATRVGGADEIVIDGETGLLVAPHDSTALAQAVVGLLDDRHTAVKLAEHARRRAIIEFAPERMVAGTLAVYADALRSVGGAS